jgi:SseB protein N-terminal domain
MWETRAVIAGLLMNKDLVASLQALRRDPAVVGTLYQQLFEATLLVLVVDPAAEPRHMSFLTYPSADATRELPVFRCHGRVLLQRLLSESDAQAVAVNGRELWPRMLDIVETGACEVAIDAGEDHGIRINREILLGMVNSFGKT